MLDFIKSKYTDDDLYAFPEGTVRTLCYQTYTLCVRRGQEGGGGLCLGARPPGHAVHKTLDTSMPPVTVCRVVSICTWR